ncbi:MAG: hypothetical protein ACE5JG_13010 [Planctomycetota bacterium]
MASWQRNIIRSVLNVGQLFRRRKRGRDEDPRSGRPAWPGLVRGVGLRWRRRRPVTWGEIATYVVLACIAVAIWILLLKQPL